MGSDLYDVRVRSRDGASVRLDVKVVHPDSMVLPEDLGFALMVLREGAEDTDPLAAEVSFENTMDAAWLTRWGKGFLRSVSIEELRDAAPPEAERDHEHPYWKDHARWMSATYAIDATHPAWVRHLTPGKTFPSRAFSETDRYDECAPVAPSTGEETLRTEGDAFLEIPRELLTRWRLGSKIPARLLHPVHAESAYLALEKVPPSRRADLEGWIGEPIRYEDRFGRVRDGALVAFGEWLTIVDFTSGTAGCSHLPERDLRWIGRLAYREGARTGERLTLGSIVGRTPPTVIATRKTGATLQLAIRCHHERKRPRVESAGQALAVLAAPLLEPGDRLVGDAPLARRLEAEKKAGGRPFLSEVYARVANGYVKRFELRAPPHPTWPDVDAIPDAAARYDTLPWPEWELTIEVFDPAWLAHFPAAPFVLDGGSVPEPAPWSGPPASWP